MEAVMTKRKYEDYCMKCAKWFPIKGERLYKEWCISCNEKFVQERPCLKCDKPFISIGTDNRICEKCKIENKTYMTLVDAERRAEEYVLDE